MKKLIIAGATALAAFASPAMSAGFVNGAFEDGNTNGWDVYSSRYRAGVLNSGLTPAYVKASVDSPAHSSIVAAGTVDPNVGALLGSTVYSGNFSYRVEDTTFGGYASLIEQKVTNYTDASIFFAWKSVLLGAHGVNDAATMIITLTDVTTGTELISREYNAASGGNGVDPRFSLDANGNYYTPQWQIEELQINGALAGHDFLLSVLAADCQPTGHWGYVYLDGFGAVAPPPGGVPEPATWAMLISGFAVIGASMRRRKTAVSFA